MNLRQVLIWDKDKRLIHDEEIRWIWDNAWSTQPTLAFFSTRSPNGISLAKLFKPEAEKLGFNIKIFNTSTSDKYLNACKFCDLVVLDASIENEGEHNYVYAFPIPVEHLLIVSRTYLPLNFYGERDSISDSRDGSLIYGAPLHPGFQSNENILHWLILQLQDLLPSLPRPLRDKGDQIMEVMSRASDIRDQRRKRDGEIFISYRSQDSKQVKHLEERIQNGTFPEGRSKKVRYFPPGFLSEEIMTEQRRWQVLSMIRRYMSPADEVWIYETKEYYNSWWTLGELTVLAYWRTEGGSREKNPPKVKIFDPKTDTVRDTHRDYLPKMSDKQVTRMARFFANSDAAQMGPEYFVAARVLANALPKDSHPEVLGILQDHVWTDKFLKYPILDCRYCRQIGKNLNQFDVESFLWHKDLGFHYLTPNQMKVAVEQRKVTCPGCKTLYRLENAPSHYHWMPVRYGISTGDLWMKIFDMQTDEIEDASLIRLPTYSIKEQNKSSLASWLTMGLLISMVISLFYNWKIDLILIPVFVFLSVQSIILKIQFRFP